MANRRDGTYRKKTRRQVLATGLAGLAGAGVTGAGAKAAGAQSAGAQAGAQRSGEWTPKKEVIRRPGQTPPAPGTPGPLLSSCIRSGHLLFVAGIGGWYPDRRKEPGDIKVQIQSALTTMKEILENAGSSMANVLKVHMTVADPNKNIALLNEGYRGFFPDPAPARSYSGAAADQMGRDGVLVQVDCIAYVD
jgi:enamine deaminase RidA (YjgF/YER057c/UK114 family)